MGLGGRKQSEHECANITFELLCTQTLEARRHDSFEERFGGIVNDYRISLNGGLASLRNSRIDFQPRLSIRGICPESAVGESEL